jgi:hypothetical protein
MKNKIAERNLINKGYSIEWVYSPRGKQICMAIKEGQKTIFATTLINLEKEVLKLYSNN